MSVIDESWRVGNKVSINVYRGNGGNADHVAAFHSAEDARLGQCAPEALRMLRKVISESWSCPICGMEVNGYSESVHMDDCDFLLLLKKAGLR